MCGKISTGRSVILKSTEYILAVLQATFENNYSLKYCL